jgi:hypothetical protein
MLSRIRSLMVALLTLAAGAACHATEPGAGFNVLKYQRNFSPDLPAKSVAGVETIKLRSLALAFHHDMSEKVEKRTIAGLISSAAKKLCDDFEYIRETNSHSGEKGGETEERSGSF